MNTPPYQPLFWGDYHKNTAHLRVHHHGALLMLISHCWGTGKPLPDDDELLSHIARAPLKEWRRIRPVIEPFFVVADRTWRHEGVEKELRNAEGRIATARANANKRWQRNAPALLAQCSSSPSPSSSPERQPPSEVVSLTPRKRFFP